MSSLPLIWSPSLQDTDVEKFCRKWLGVRFQDGGDSLFGIDCSHFAGRVLDELSGRRRHQEIVFSSQCGIHNAVSAQKQIDSFLSLYSELKLASPISASGHYSVRAGDLLALGPVAGGASHIMLVGGQKDRLWSCTALEGVDIHNYNVSQVRGRLKGVYTRCSR